MQNRDENDENGLSGNSSNTWRALRHRVEGTSNLACKLVQGRRSGAVLWRRLAGTDGGGERRRVGGTGTAWAREWLRSSGAGAACASVGERVRWRSEELGRGGGLEWRAGGARAAAERRTGAGCRATVSREGRRTVRLMRGARGEVK